MTRTTLILSFSDNHSRGVIDDRGVVSNERQLVATFSGDRAQSFGHFYGSWYPVVTGNYAVAKFMREFRLRCRGNVSWSIKLFNDNGFVLTFHSVTRCGECLRIFRRNLYGRRTPGRVYDFGYWNFRWKVTTQFLDIFGQSFRDATMAHPSCVFFGFQRFSWQEGHLWAYIYLNVHTYTYISPFRVLLRVSLTRAETRELPARTRRKFSVIYWMSFPSVVEAPWKFNEPLKRNILFLRASRWWSIRDTWSDN